MTSTGARTLRVVLLVMLTVFAAGLGYLAVAGGRQALADHRFHPIAIPSPTAADSAAAGALTGSSSAASGASPSTEPPEPSASAVQTVVDAKLASPALGTSTSAQVYDAATGATLMNERADQQVAPASTAKLLTAAALLNVHRVTDRFTTRVVAGASPGTVVLVGGGDPTLSAAAAGEPTAYPEAARVTDLATQVTKSLAGVKVRSVIVDDSLFSGPTTAPGWAPDDVPSSYASAITAAMVDGGRDAPTAAIRSGTPDLAAGQALAAVLGARTVTFAKAPAGAKELASVGSAPVGRLIEEMLSDSDNVIAEVLARQVALADGKPASFAGGAAAVSAELAKLGITVGSRMLDGSGLSAADRIPASALGQVLVAAAGQREPRLRPILAGLSVAGWDGTLAEQGRFDGPSANGVGVVRAKTGSLTGVSGIAGVVTDTDGRLLVFSIVADGVPGGDPDSAAARAVLDAAVAALARCGCR